MIEIVVNGETHTVEATPETPLLYVLRNELGMNGPKFGCGLGQCGACTVHVDGYAVRSCSFPVGSLENQKVTTIEGLGAEYAKVRGTQADGQLHPVQQAFLEEGALQCGYCTSGMIMSAAALLQAVPKPTDSQIRENMSGNLCRCGVHLRILAAIKRAAAAMA
jgi:aerobic-type carbon monoxide dehydrogenase small subunit (CoxS/CutS family)